MASSMVIKVKYGDMLRRFNANVNENDQLDLDMVGLKAKVSSLFSLDPDADITLTYIDEDGDVVALVNDDDLRDVMRQQLKFLRIDVQLNNAQGGRSYARSSGSSTPLRSPRERVAVPNINRAAADVLQALPEAFRAPLLKLSADVASKAASSSSIVADLIEAFTKMGMYTTSPDFQSESGRETSACDKASENPNVPAVSGSSGDGKQQVFPKQTNPVEASSKSNQGLPESNEVGAGNIGVGMGATVTPHRPSVDLNKPPADCDSSEPAHVKFAPVAVCAADNMMEQMKMMEKMKMICDLQRGKLVGSEASGSSSIPAKPVNIPAKPVKLGPAQAPDGHNNNPINECPFFGLPVLTNTSENSVPFRPFHPFKRHHAEAMGGIFHRGIRCDGCGVHPITGPRFKSKVKENYDLCNICFLEMGTEADYIRIDRPMSFRHPRSFKGLHDHRPGAVPPVLPHVMMGCGSKCTRPKLDSRFILDVNVNDDTLMPPSTPFTKIWRMRNNGGLVWPQGTQLVWIGGDRFSQALSVEMEIPANGVAVDGELDIAVDFIAPEYPGRYVSYWRMSTPSGQKFGQRVWVLIQVDAALKNSFPSGLPINLDQPQSNTKDPKVVDVKDNSNKDSDLPKPSKYWFTEPEKPMYKQQPKNEQEQKFPINDNLLVGHGVSTPPATEAISSVLYPVIDLTEEPSDDFFSESAPAVPVPAPVTYPAPTVVNATSSAPPIFYDASPSEGTSGKNVQEEALLKELEEMGFKQVSLNKEILRLNEYNLEQSVDDLCGVSEWDPILEELEEMGFCDTETNKKLLAKNNGSIKRVVMDLINGEKA